MIDVEAVLPSRRDAAARRIFLGPGGQFTNHAGSEHNAYLLTGAPLCAR